jgi:hypothetical protein
MSENKTQPTKVAVEGFIATVEIKRRREDAETLLNIYKQATGQPAVIWGPSIIGFGTSEYKYDSGREGTTPTAAYSPRKSNLTLYVGDKFEGAAELYARLGKYKKSVACLYINKLADIDLSVLHQIIEKDYLHSKDR